MMLGRTAGALMWMARYLERTDFTVRLLEAGLRLEITGADEQNVWESILVTTGLDERYDGFDDGVERDAAIDYLLRDRANPSSITNLIDLVRSNAQVARVTLPGEVAEAVNECRREIHDLLAEPVAERDLPATLHQLLRLTAQVHGVVQTTMFRGEPFQFVRLGTLVERADNTARILDVKYYVLLPSLNPGSFLDVMQWELILRSVAALKSYRRQQSRTVSATGIIEFLVLNQHQPRSLRHCSNALVDHLRFLADRTGEQASVSEALDFDNRLSAASVQSIIDEGTHEFLEDCIERVHQLSDQIERDFRFNPEAATKSG